MNHPAPTPLRIAIACGGTGGHLFPGLAVANQLVGRGCAVTLLVSPKEVDQQAVREAANVEIVTLPAVGLTRGGEIAFVRGFSRAYRTAKRLFESRRPQAALAMGGFTSAAPVLAARRMRARTFLHESNSIPGRANRWLSWMVNRAFIGFPSAAGRLRARKVIVTGTPVRSEFRAADARACRTALGLDPERPVLLVMGGSQGARGINELVARSLPLIADRAPSLQWLHLAGPNDAARIARTYADLHVQAVVHAFFHRMELALGAATATISRAGASSLAEIAAMRLPSVLVPYPAATDNHQFHNARAMEACGAARLLEQSTATPETLANLLWDLIEKPAVREQMQNALAQWHAPGAAERIAEEMLEAVGVQAGRPSGADWPEIPLIVSRPHEAKSGAARSASVQEPRRPAANAPRADRPESASKPEGRAARRQ